jgi:hypothetical protein
VDDFDTANTELREVLGARARVIASFEDLAEAVDALSGAPEDELLRTGVRFHYRVESAYAAARRVLDRLVVVAHELLPRSETDLGNSHSGFDRRLPMRCADIGLAVPESLLAQIGDLDTRIKAVRDQMEHPTSPLWVRSTDARGELKAGTHRVVRTGEDAAQTHFEPAAVLREGIHAYVRALVDLIESARAA